MSDHVVAKYIDHCRNRNQQPHTETIAYLANLEMVSRVSPQIAHAILAELNDQRQYLKLIASENYCSLSVQLAMGNLLTDKYAEGISGARFYAGCKNVDEIETYAANRAKELFGAEHAYVQPHSGIDANMVAFLAVLSAKAELPKLEEMGLLTKTGAINVRKLAEMDRAQWEQVRAVWGAQRMLALDFRSGGHLTHGYRMNVSAHIFDVASYSVDRQTGLLDYDAIEKQALDFKPLILLAGYSAYPRKIDFARMRRIADKIDAVLMVDMAHFAGLVAGGVFGDKSSPYNPVAHAHIVTSTTHKTLRGPRSGLVLCDQSLAKFVDKGCPLVLGGPLPHVMAAKAICFDEALSPEFGKYAHQIVANARRLAEELAKRGLTVLTGGTDNHIVLVNVDSTGLTGIQAEYALRECGITLNRNAIPYDQRSPFITSGLRIGTPAITTLGMRESEMVRVAELIHTVLDETTPAADSEREFNLPEATRTKVHTGVRDLLKQFPLYPNLDAEFIAQHLAASPQPASAS